MWAVMKDQVKFFEEVIPLKEIDLMETNAQSENLLHLAARRHHMKVARLVVEEVKARFRRGNELWEMNAQKDEWHLSPILRLSN